MKRETILWLSVIVLAVLNLASLAFIIWAASGRPEQRFDKTVIESLRLNKTQIERFNQLKRQHHRQMVAADEQMRKPFVEYFGLLTGERNEVKEDSLEKILSMLYKQKVQMTYEHFAQIRAMCTVEQQNDFKKIVPMFMKVVAPEKRELPRGK